MEDQQKHGRRERKEVADGKARMSGTTLPRVLVADDESSIRLLVSRVLKRAGFEPVEATDGQDAIEHLDAGEYDVLVLDLMMPRVDGFGVVEHLIETQPRMMEKTVVMTAFPKAAAKERLHHLCCIISKPFEVAELVSLVRECAAR
jgi:CheY-like chemotaxis protein